jgi:uncharacterized membrane protein YgcG
MKSNTNSERHNMKNIRLLTFVLIIGTLVLSACGAAATATPAPENARSAKVEAMPVSFVGIVDSMAGDQWVISGTTLTVDASIVRNGPFNVGDRIKVEGLANPDGSFTVSRVEAPTPQETATLPPFTDDNSNDAISNSNTNDANINDGNVNDDNSNSANSNDDNGIDANSNDDNSNSVNSNDDSNINDDNGNDANSNDDHGGNSNSDDSSGNDDNSGSGGGNDNGGGSDDSGGGNGNGG